MTTTSHRAGPLPATGHAGFGRTLLSEWTKLHSVRRWIVGLLAAPVLTVLVSLLAASASHVSTDGEGPVIVGPDGQRVQDRFHFVHQPLTGDGTVVIRVVSADVEFRVPRGEGGDARAAEVHRPEWAKAGIMIKDGLTPGSRYAAVMVTPSHGVRLQSNYTTDIAGPAATAPTWLKLKRSGTSIAAFQSADGVSWTRVGTVTVAGLPQTVEVGPFVASPGATLMRRQFGSTSVIEFTTRNRGVFDQLKVEPAAASQQPAEWQDEIVGAIDPPEGMEMKKDEPPGAEWTGDRLTMLGSGDIAPNAMPDDMIRQSLSGVYVGLMAIVAVAVLFITAEYKRGMVRTTFTASPGRGRVLVAKALVMGGVTFVIGLVASTAALLVARPLLRKNGYKPPLFPDWSLTDGPVLRTIVGTALVLAMIAVFSLALGSVLRRSAGAVSAVIVLIVLPQIIATALPLPAALWLMRLTPAAGFSVQQTTPHYEQVSRICVPEDGCSYDQPWAGFGVLCAYALVTLAVAIWMLRRRDA